MSNHIPDKEDNDMRLDSRGRMRTNGVAHISFAGGGLLVPARDPYEREVLVEHVRDRARRMGGVRLVVRGRAWNVTPTSDGFTRGCARCGRALEATCCATAPDGDPRCLGCACEANTTAIPDAVELRNQIKNQQPVAALGVLAAVFRWAGGPLGRSAA